MLPPVKLFGIVLGVVVGTGLVVGVVASRESARVRAAAVAEAREHNQVVALTLQTRLERAAAAALTMANDGALDEASGGVTEQFRRMAGTFAKLGRDVDQVRLLSAAGRELYRVRGDGSEVPEAELQDKSERDYFLKGRELSRGKVEISEFDLNVENGEIEVPFRPVVRLTTPVWTDGGRLQGLVVVNLSLSRLFEILDRTFPKDALEIELLDAEGYWERGGEPDQQWGDQVPGREGATLAKMRPELWAAMGAEAVGSRVEEGETFVWSRLDLPTGEDGALEVSGTDWVDEQIVLSRISKATMAAALLPVRAGALGAFAVIAASISWLAISLYRGSRERREAAARLREIFRSAPVALLAEDWSEVAGEVEKLRGSGVTDLERHLADHPAVVADLRRKVRITEVNEAAVGMFEAEGREALIGSRAAVRIGDEELATFRQKLLAWVAGADSFRNEVPVRTLRGNVIEALMRVTFCKSGERMGRVLVGLVDVTERTRIERELGEQRMLLEKVERVAGTGSWRWEVGAERLVWSEGMFEIFARSPGEGAPRFDEQEELFDPAHREQLRALVAGAVERGRDYQLELAIRVPDAESRWIEMRGFPVRDARGRVVELYGFVRDTTDRREVERELRVLAAVAAQTDNMVIICDAERRIEWVNRAFEKVSGYALAEVIGKIPGEFLQGEGTDPEAVAEMRRKLDHGESFETEVLNYRKDGTPFWVRFRVEPLRNDEGELTHFTSVQSDVTLDKRRTEELRSYAVLLERTGEIGNVGGWEFDVAAMTPIWTEQTRRMHEVEDDFVPTLGNALDFYPEEAREVIRPALARSLETGEAFDCEVPFVTAKGRRIVVRVKWTVEMRDGKARRVYGVIRDVTERREIERELVQAKERAEAASVAKSQFVANMSHEIRTPLNAILGMCDLMREAPTAEESLEYLDTIRASGDALLDLVTDVLSFSKIESGTLELREVNVTVREFAKECLGLERPAADKRGLSLSMDVDAGVPTLISADRARLRQVVVNLLANAIKFTAVGHVRLNVGPGRGLIGGPAIRFSVSDTGIGIAEQDRSRIFEMFDQVDDSDSRRFGGAGLGLAISARLVELMGGVIGVESAVGVGSEFRFEIPMRTASEGADASGATHLALDHAAGFERPLSILVAEDSAINQRLILAVLKKMGYGADVVADGAQALESARRRGYDVILMDLQMPVMGGRDAAEAILADAQTGYPQIIALTANAQDEERERCLEAGMVEFLTKPLRNSDLAKALETAHGRIGAAA